MADSPVSSSSRFALSGTTLVLLASVLWGTTGTAQSFAPAGAPSASIGALRLVAASIALGVLVALRGSWRDATGRLPVRAILAAALGVAAYQMTFFAGVRLTGVAVGTIIGIGSSPIFAGLLDFALYRRAPGRRWFIATGLAVAGCTLLTLGGSADIVVEPRGVLLTLTAGFAYALYGIMAKGVVEKLPPDAATAAMMGDGEGLLIPVWLGSDLSWLTTPDARGLLVVVHLGVVATALSYTLFASGLRLIAASTAVTLTLMEPLTAAVLGVLVVGESLTALMVVGALLVFAGLMVLSVGER
jgi:DME family drug/metabolite transporter